MGAGILKKTRQIMKGRKFRLGNPKTRYRWTGGKVVGVL